MGKYKGMFYTILSAIIFGFTPILAKLSYSGGGNGITITFLRAVLALPVLYLILKIKGISLKLTKKQWKEVALVGSLGTGATTVMLYMSYNYISVGLATSLHFIYPLVVTLACRFLFKETLTRKKWLALLCGAVGILCLIEPGTMVHKTGIILSLLSGVCYSFYIVYLARSDLKDIHYMKLSFYLCVMMGLVSFLFGLGMGDLTLHLTPQAWLYALLVSLFTSVGALSLFQLGIRLIGPSNASMLSTLEPITSLILGVLVFQESLTLFMVLGGLCIVASVLLIAKS